MLHARIFFLFYFQETILNFQLVCLMLLSTDIMMIISLIFIYVSNQVLSISTTIILFLSISVYYTRKCITFIVGHSPITSSCYLR